MSSSGSDDGPSFDPHSWAGGKAGDVEDGPPKPTDTFDPKAWTAPVHHAAPAKPRSSPWGPLLGVLAVAAVCGGGFAVWRTMHPDHPAAPAKPGPAVAVVSAPATVSLPPVPAGSERRSLTLSGPDEVLASLTSAGVVQADAQSAAQAGLAKLGAGKGELRVLLALQQSGGGVVLTRLEARHDDGSGAVVVRQASGGYAATAASANLTEQVKVVRGQMDTNSFYSSAVAAGVDDDLIPGFAQAFAFDFDFQREIKPGDVFEAVFEQQVDPTGASVGAGKLLYVSLETSAKSKALYWYAPAGKPGGWFDGNGRSVIRSLMRTPVEGARISSPFGVRMHPVLGFMKMHNGTDFAAPVGTPIYAAGDGIVEFSGMKGPNGNFTKILHPNGWETLYLHQSAISPAVVAGAHVSQSQEIGLVGATGVDSAGHSTVTGPHLHYEVHINNQPVDPMSIVVGSGQALGGADLTAFTTERNRIDGLRVAQGG
jgi:murein DD-endopeptidase MepM/ murein hydrolase activator NlpD